MYPATATNSAHRRLIKHRRPFIVASHLVLFAIADYLAWALRFDGSIPSVFFNAMLRTLIWVILIRALVFVPFRLYTGLWRYTSTEDLSKIVGAVIASEAIVCIAVRFFFHDSVYPRSVFIVDPLLLICLTAALRLAPRLYFEATRFKASRRILIYGAGDAAEMLVRNIKKNALLGYVPIGIIDDNSATVGQNIHGVPVLGTREQLPAVIARKKPDELLIAIPSAEPRALRSIISSLQAFKLPIKTVPNLCDILDGRVSVHQVRDVSLEDLLPRPAVGLNRETLKKLIAGKRVLVTGAGGSIGSELCRRIAKLKPEQLVLVERYENNLYWIENELRAAVPRLDIQAVIGDVSDRARIDDVFRRSSLQIVFHAAAAKHVPLMEMNPCEAVKNNIIGTGAVAAAADRYGAEVFVLISTDKAVNPTSIMGATKKVAETLVQSISAHSTSRFVTVRFGNVLGSSGSVVPRFLEQIRSGGPVTVTDREMRRFFMLIPEAVELVLHAAAMTDTGNVYVLKMGEQVSIFEMACNLIRLSGYVPGEEIPIEFTGLRPGEKLYEELVGEDESAESSEIAEILRVRSFSVIDRNVFQRQILDLERVALNGDSQSVIRLLQEIVPTFRCDVSPERGLAVFGMKRRIWTLRAPALHSASISARAALPEA